MGVQEKLSHLSLSISTWHLGRANDQEATYPRSQSSLIPPQPSLGLFGVTLPFVFILHFLAYDSGGEVCVHL